MYFTRLAFPVLLLQRFLFHRSCCGCPRYQIRIENPTTQQLILTSNSANCTQSDRTLRAPLFHSPVLVESNFTVKDTSLRFLPCVLLETQIYENAFSVSREALCEGRCYVKLLKVHFTYIENVFWHLVRKFVSTVLAISLSFQPFHEI